MTIFSTDPAVQNAVPVRPLTEINERECLAKWARKTPPGGLNVEIGGCIGGTTAVIALANPTADVIVIDTFEWWPPDDTPTSKSRLLANMESVGAHNVTVIEGDSRLVAQMWTRPIDFIFIDGGHSFDWVYPDLCNFAPHAKVVALHDFGNPAWPSIAKAVSAFMADNPTWRIVEVVGMVVVLTHD